MHVVDMLALWSFGRVVWPVATQGCSKVFGELFVLEGLQAFSAGVHPDRGNAGVYWCGIRASFRPLSAFQRRCV